MGAGGMDLAHQSPQPGWAGRWPPWGRVLIPEQALPRKGRLRRGRAGQPQLHLLPPQSQTISFCLRDNSQMVLTAGEGLRSLSRSCNQFITQAGTLTTPPSRPGSQLKSPRPSAGACPTQEHLCTCMHTWAVTGPSRLTGPSRRPGAAPTEGTAPSLLCIQLAEGCAPRGM